MTIGELIKRARKQGNMSQKDLAEKLGVSTSMIGQYETDARNPKLVTLQKIATALQVELTTLLPSNVIKSLQLDPDDKIYVGPDGTIYLQSWSATDPSVAEHYDQRSSPRNIKRLVEKLETTLIPCRDSDCNHLLKLIDNYVLLNEVGKHIAVERVEELTEIPKYQKEPPQD